MVRKFLLVEERFDKTTPCLHVYSYSGPERKTDNLSMQKSYIALFLQQNIEKVSIA